ncbi:hypothetical protein [Pseudomonas sp.]|uniref:hypothetical protein n=1 Tax=Pseudomonas sp. TaxID=306 RepID=UPI00273082E8|nr:hypothetical protein [Pseudomonas sp.]MDP2245682.1 hypothetical protein [Pseudomonas sp.]
MDVRQIWRKESRKRIKNQLRCERVNRNWPLHAQRVVDVFREIQAEGDKHGVVMFVQEPEWFQPTYDGLGRRYGKYPLGETSVILCFMRQRTGTGVFERTEEGDTHTFDYEEGAQLVVHHSPDQGVVQVFFSPPRLSKDNKEEALLYTHTFNSDDLTRDWVMRLVPCFFTFNRVESLLERPSVIDRLRVRWWRFIDIRNRRGYLEKLQHVLTPWELILIAGTTAPLLWLLSWLWKLLNPINL